MYLTYIHSYWRQLDLFCLCLPVMQRRSWGWHCVLQTRWLCPSWLLPPHETGCLTTWTLTVAISPASILDLSCISAAVVTNNWSLRTLKLVLSTRLLVSLSKPSTGSRVQAFNVGKHPTFWKCPEARYPLCTTFTFWPAFQGLGHGWKRGGETPYGVC